MLAAALLATLLGGAGAAPVGLTSQLREAFRGAEVHHGRVEGGGRGGGGLLRARGKGGANVETHFYLDAVLDHYHASVANEPATWKQRFYVDSSFWKGDGAPVFLYIGGEGSLGPPGNGLFFYQLAEKYGALVVALEHRFYGESFPTEDMSVSNLEYLTSEQALADIARFVDYVNNLKPGAASDLAEPALTLPHSSYASPWVAFGGSYPGSLSSWVRLKYPGLIAGSIASSAPVLAELDFTQYLQVVGKAMANEDIGGSQECYDAVADAVKTVHNAVTGSGVSVEALPSMLTPCGSVEDQRDLYTYEQGIYGAWQGIVQYNLEQPNAPTVASMCEAVLAAKDDHLTGLANAVKTVYSDDADCMPSSWEEDMMADLKNTTFSGPGCEQECSAMRQWIWQSCNEFGFFQTSTGADHPFAAFTESGYDVAGATLCAAAYDGLAADADLGARTGLTNRHYGARAADGTNITYVHGSMDPWHALGVVAPGSPFFESCNARADLGEDPRCDPQEAAAADVVFIANTAHCRDMYSPNADADTEAIAKAHAAIEAAVARYAGVSAAEVTPASAPAQEQ